MFLPQSERPKFAPIQHNWQNYISVYLIFWYFDMRREDKYFGVNNSKHSPNLIYSWFHHECHYDLLVFSPSILILPHFQTIHFLYFYSGSELNSDDERYVYTLCSLHLLVDQYPWILFYGIYTIAQQINIISID
jgi:hypothetical protein